MEMGFESRLAKRISSRRDTKRGWKTYASFVGVIFIVITLTSSTLAVPQATVHTGTKTSVAKYLGQFDCGSNVLMLGALTPSDWICIKVPFKGRLSDLQSISFSEFVSQTGGVQAEPFVVLKLQRGMFLVCHPELSYVTGEWSLPYFSWQSRDTVANGKWNMAPVSESTDLNTLQFWTGALGNVEVVMISIFVGMWELTSPYQCYLGDYAINGKLIDLANSKRTSSGGWDLPAGF